METIVIDQLARRHRETKVVAIDIDSTDARE